MQNNVSSSGNTASKPQEFSPQHTNGTTGDNSTYTNSPPPSGHSRSSNEQKASSMVSEVVFNSSSKAEQQVNGKVKGIPVSTITSGAGNVASSIVRSSGVIVSSTLSS